MLINAVHDVLTATFTPIYQDAIYCEKVTNGGSDFAEPSITEIEHPCKVQIDTSGRKQRADSGVNTNKGRARILTETLDVIPKAQDRIRYTPIGDPEISYTVVDFLETDGANTYYLLSVVR